jgi:DUF2971 family protein
MLPVGPPFEQIQEASRGLLNQLFAPAPESLFHYTSGEGLLGILRSGVLRGSNYAFMNDRSEFTYGASLLREVVEERSKHPHDDVDQDYYEAILRADTPIVSELYLSCFCTKGDLLSQWRGYGIQNSRYCLRFSPDQLEAIHGASPVVPVLYDRSRQRVLLNALLDRHLEGLYSVASAERHAFFYLMASCTYACCLGAFALLKDDSFEEEHEWRSMLLVRPGEYEDRLVFAPAAGLIKPTLPLLRASDGDKLPLREIICGASANPEQAVRAAKLMLAHYKYSAICVTPSRIPLSG